MTELDIVDPGEDDSEDTDPDMNPVGDVEIEGIDQSKANAALVRLEAQNQGAIQGSRHEISWMENDDGSFFLTIAEPNSSPGDTLANFLVVREKDGTIRVTQQVTIEEAGDKSLKAKDIDSLFDQIATGP